MEAVEQAFDRVSAQAESIRSDDERCLGLMDLGDELRQGDIYVTRIAGVPKGAVRQKSPALQLAPGTTQGSRHTLKSLAGVRVFRVASPGPLDGPVLDATEGLVIEHPEHGNRVLPAGCYAVTYQRAYGNELRRVAD